MTDQTPQQPEPQLPEPQSPVAAPAPTPMPDSPRRRLGPIVAGAVLILIGAGWLAEVLGAANVPWRVLLPAMLLVVGIALVLGARSGSHPGLIATGWVLVVAMLLAGAAEVLSGIPLAEGIGKETHRVVGVAQSEYRWGVGSLIVDLTRSQVPPGGTIEASVAIGELVVIVPPGLTVEVSARSGIGDVSVFDQHNSGLGATLEYADPPGIVPPLQLVAEVGMGKVEVRR